MTAGLSHCPTCGRYHRCVGLMPAQEKLYERGKGELRGAVKKLQSRGRRRRRVFPPRLRRHCGRGQHELSSDAIRTMSVATQVVGSGTDARIVRVVVGGCF